MELPHLLDRINAFPWSKYAQPGWNKPSSIGDALAKLVRADSAAYDSVLYAVGNNHGGTYYPVLLPVMPFLEEVIERGESLPQRAALCVLDDLFASFHPEPGHELADVGDGTKVDVEAAFRQRMHSLRPALERIASEGGTNSELAREVLQALATDVAWPNLQV